MPMESSPLPPPTIGATVLLANGPTGWDPPALLLTTPLVLLRYRRGVASLTRAGDAAPFHQRECDPLAMLAEVFTALRNHIPAAGPRAGKPAFPLATVAMAYEFGQRFAPHQEAFRHGSGQTDDEVFAAVFLDAFRPDGRGGVERIGYSGSIPSGWMDGAPELVTSPYGHDAPAIVPHATPSAVSAAPLSPVLDFAQYETLFARVQEFLAAGDIYQANLTVPFLGRTALPPEALFDAALRRGGASFAGTMILPGGTLLSFSPELLLRRRGRTVETRPIKGTRPIAGRAGGVADARDALRASEKDRAEHLMIVDLERNDLGRVCDTGSIRVDPFMRIVEHPTVVHMETTVKGKLREGLGLAELMASIYPGGSVTGAPKKRAIEVLSELESAPRGAYCGAFGWIDADGDCDLNLPIRTAILRPDGQLEYHAGGGIVADSKPDEEWRELHDKAAFIQGLLG